MHRFALIAIALLVLAAPLDAAPVSTRSQPAALHALHPAGACGTHLEAARELLRLSRACGHDHPSKVPLERMEVLSGSRGLRPAGEVYRGVAVEV